MATDRSDRETVEFFFGVVAILKYLVEIEQTGLPVVQANYFDGSRFACRPQRQTEKPKKKKPILCHKERKRSMLGDPTTRRIVEFETSTLENRARCGPQEAAVLLPTKKIKNNLVGIQRFCETRRVQPVSGFFMSKKKKKNDPHNEIPSTHNRFIYFFFPSVSRARNVPTKAFPGDCHSPVECRAKG